MSNPEIGHDRAPDSHQPNELNMFRKLAALITGSAALVSGAEAANQDSRASISTAPEPQAQTVEQAPATNIEPTTTSQEQAPVPGPAPTEAAVSPTTTEAAHLIPPISMTKNIPPHVDQAPPTTAEVSTTPSEHELVLRQKIKNGESLDILQGKIAQVQVSINPDKFISYEINDPIEIKAADGKVIGLIGFMQTDELPNWQGDAVKVGNQIEPGETFQPLIISFGEKSEFSNSTVQIAGLSKPATINLAEADKDRSPIDMTTIDNLATSQSIITENASGVFIDANGQYPATAIQKAAGLS